MGLSSHPPETPVNDIKAGRGVGHQDKENGREDNSEKIQQTFKAGKQLNGLS